MINIEDIRKTGEIQLDSGNYSGAKKTFLLGLQHSDKYSYQYTIFHTLIGETEIKQNNFEQALKNLQEASKTEWGETNPYILFLLGKTFYELKRTEEARRCFFAVFHLSNKEFFTEENERYWILIEKGV